jgi:hypothetical protein
MDRPRPRHALLATAMLTALAVPIALPASARDTTSTDAPRPQHTTRPQRTRPTVDLETVRARCVGAIDQRLAALAALDHRIATANRLSDEQAAGLTATIDATRTGLTTLRVEVEADPDATTLREDCKRVVEEHRVYVLLGPQVRVVIGADSAQSAVDLVEGSLDDVQAAIDAAEADGEDVTEATRLLAEVQGSIAEADALAAGVLDAVAPLTAADFNDGSAAPLLREARGDLGQAARELAAARADLARIRALLA